MTPRKNTQLFIAECERRHIPFTLHTESILEVHLGEGFFCADSRTPLQSSALAHICQEKYLTKIILDHHQIPTAAWKIVWKKQIIFPNTLTPPLVCKYPNGKEGIGFEYHIHSQNMLEDYFQRHPLLHKALLEEELQGKEYRVLLIGKKVCSILEHNWDTGKKQLFEVSKELSSEVKAFFEHVAYLFKAEILGIDIIMDDLRSIPNPRKRQGILELNSAPSLWRHYHPDAGEGINPAVAIFDLLEKKFKQK